MAEVSIPINIILFALSFAPSVIWLSLFLTKDPRPEPKYLIVRVFFFGIIVAPVVVLLEALVAGVSRASFLPETLTFLALAAFTEEYMKYWTVKNTVLSKPDFDEPHDAIIYMISAALGFAAMENILIVILNVYPAGGFDDTLGIIALRFTGATLLHALASGIVGYFLGLAWFFYHFKKQIVAFGLILASALHFVFNSFVFLGQRTGPEASLIPNTAILLAMLVLVLVLFDKLRQRHQQFIQRVSTQNTLT